MVMDVVTYWAGYLAQSSAVQQLPPNISETQINEVILAFLGPMADSSVETTFINSNHSDDTLLGAGLCALKARNPNTRLTISLLDTPQTHWSDTSFNPDLFVASLFAKIEEWGLNVSDMYYNIDLETGGEFVPGFTRLIDALNKGLAAKGITDPRLSLVGYTGSSDEQVVIQYACKQVYRLSTMDYYNPAQNRIALAQMYAKWIGNESSKICILGKAPLDGDPGTPISVMQEIVAGYPTLGGIGIWPLVFSAIASSIITYAEQIVGLATLADVRCECWEQVGVVPILAKIGGHREDVDAFRALQGLLEHRPVFGHLHRRMQLPLGVVRHPMPEGGLGESPASGWRPSCTLM